MTSIPPVQAFPIGPGTLCAGCGYDLGGLLSSAHCPECHTPAEFSLRPDLLRFAPLEYLRTLRTGIRLLIAGILANITVGVLGSLIMLYFAFSQGAQQQGNFSPSTALMTTQHAITTLSLIVQLVILYATWLFTTPHPAWQGDLDPRSRKTLRILVPIYVLLQLASAVPAYWNLTNPLGFTPGSTMSSSMTGMLVVSGLLGIGALILTILVLVFGPLYAKTLATRLDEPGSARFAGVLAWLLPILATVGACLLVGPLVAAVLALVLLFVLNSRFNECIHLRERDNDPDAPPIQPHFA